ncbi:MAG: M6 family metalloprotease domain-containing protein [bacterium]
MKKCAIFLLWLTIVGITQAGAVAPVMPGVQAPSIIIDRTVNESEKFYPRPMLAYTMERYAEAKRMGLDEVDDIYAYSPVICGKYSNSGGDDWPISQMQTQLFDGPWGTITMREYYEEISYDQFHLSGAVYGWYTSTLTQQYVVGNSQGFGPDAHLGEFFVQLLNAADPTTNFSQYDNDGPDGLPNSGDDDGIVDALFFIHDGPGGETGAANIWSHSSSIVWLIGNYFITNDLSASGGSILIGPYIVQPSVNQYGSIIEIGVFSHEYGHALGLPDLYDSDYSSEGIGNWGLMGGGSWNTPVYPAHMCAWSRYKMGWIEPVEIALYSHDQLIPAIETSGIAFKLWTGGYYTSQYFMVENRQRYGSDLHLYGEGLLIWHVDETAQQTNEDHPKVDLEEADGFDQLYYGYNRGDPGDIYPGTYNNLWFDEYTYPSSQTYASGVTQVAVWNISAESDTMTANLDVIYSQPLLEIISVTINDATGNNDGRADPGESIGLWITVENLWASASGLVGVLATPSNLVDLTDSTAQFGLIASHFTGNNQSDPFQISVHPDAPEGEPLTLSLYISGSGGYTQDFEFEILIGRAPILVVDDDLGEDYEQYIASSLGEIDAVYEIWDVLESGSPGSQIAKYEALLWMTGDDAQTTLDSVEITYLEQYLDSGGTLILTGQGINEDLGATTFFSDYLKCSPHSNSLTQYFLNGAVANPLSSGMSLLLTGAQGAGNQNSPSSVYPLDIAEELFSYMNAEIGGISYENPVSQAHVIYLAFGLEAVSGMANTSTRANLLSAIFTWAQTTPVKEISESPPMPTDFTVRGVYPNPFNPSTTLRFSIPRAEQVVLTIYDSSGRIVSQILNHRLNAGEHDVNWNASNQPSGIYFYHIKAGAWSQAGKLVLMK